MLTTLAGEIAATPWSQADTDTLYSEMVGAVEGLYDSEWTFPQLTVLAGNDGPALRFVTTGNEAGTRSTVTSPPPNVAYLLRKNTSFAGRRYRGRMFLPGSSNGGIQQGGILSGAEFTLVDAAAGALDNVFQGVGSANLSQPVLLHSEAPTTPTPVTSLSAELIVATQRRRLVRTN